MQAACGSLAAKVAVLICQLEVLPHPLLLKRWALLPGYQWQQVPTGLAPMIKNRHKSGAFPWYAMLTACRQGSLPEHIDRNARHEPNYFRMPSVSQ